MARDHGLRGGHQCGGGDLVGELSFSGERHGRDVSIAHRPKSAVTAIQGTFPKRTLSSPAAMAALTGEAAKYFRSVAATVGGNGILVRRSGNGAGRYLYHDLYLAERLAESVSTAEA
jgi:hypothetical protein